MCHSRAWAEEARNSRNFRSNYLGEARGRAGQETGGGRSHGVEAGPLPVAPCSHAAWPAQKGHPS